MVMCDNSMAAEHRDGRREGGIEGQMRGEGWRGEVSRGCRSSNGAELKVTEAPFSDSDLEVSDRRQP